MGPRNSTFREYSRYENGPTQQTAQLKVRSLCLMVGKFLREWAKIHASTAAAINHLHATRTSESRVCIGKVLPPELYG